MNRSMTFLSSRLVRRAAGWMANFLALASVSLLGRSAEAAANSADFPDDHSTISSGQGIETQISYVQLGYKDGEDWPPPRPE